MPVATSLMKSLVEEHGEEKGRRMYYAMENKCKQCGKKKGKDCPDYCDPIMRAIREGD